MLKKMGALLAIAAGLLSTFSGEVAAQQCVSGAQINALVRQGAIRPVSALQVNGQIRKVEAVCRQNGGYVYVLVVQNGQQVSRVRVNASN